MSDRDAPARALLVRKPNELPEGTMVHLSSRSSANRECTYQVRGRTGIDSFYWNTFEKASYHQVPN